MDRTEKILVIYNSHSGKDGTRSTLGEITALLGKYCDNIETVTTEYAGHAMEIAEKSGGDYDTIVCCGGDGTLNEIASGVMRAGHKVKLSYIPMGSTNDFANTIGIPGDPVQAAALLDKDTHDYDIGSFNDRYFNYVACFGPGTSVSYATSQGMKNKLGYSAYMINGFLFQFIPTLKSCRPKHIKITYDGNVMEDDFYFGAVSNTLSVAGMFKYDSNDVRLNDGRFEVILIKRMNNPVQFFKMFAKMKKRDYDGENLIYFKASEVSFEFTNPEKWCLDGEFGGDISKADIAANKRAITVYTGEGRLLVD